MVKKVYIILTFLLFSIPLFSQQQVPVIEKVCPGEKSRMYAVHPSQEGALFQWFIEGGKRSDYDIDPMDSLIVIDWLESSDIVKYSLSVVEISEAGCYGDTTTVDIGFKDASKIVLEDGEWEIDLCAGEIKTFEVDPGFIYYEWEGGDNSLKGENANVFTIAEMSPVSYNVIVRAISVDTCETVDTINVNFNPLPRIAFESKMVGSDLSNIPEDKLTVTGDTLKICKTEYEISPGSFAAYQWSTGDNAAFIRMGEIPEDSLITVSVTNNFGCVSSDTILIQACDVPITVYSAFTPNNDDKNEEWVIEGIENFPDATVIVYDRHQNKVFESVKPYKNWDGRSQNGKLLPVDSYHYLIKLNDEKDQTFRGQVTIVY